MKKRKSLKSSKSRATSSSSSSKAKMIINSSVLSKDVMMDIFSRIPTKALCRLRCVCKEWRSIISNPFFKSLHRARSSQKPKFLFLQEKNYHRCMVYSISTTRVTMLSVDFDGTHNFEFTFTLDGYVNMLPSKWELICFVSTEGFYVCNPSTQELVKLPNPSFRDVKDGSAFGSKCPYFLRLWGVLIENNFYWIGYGDKYDDTKIGAIVSFDLGKEEFGTVVLPEGRFDSEGVWFLVELKGMLCLVDSPEDLSTMDIWVLKDSKNYMWVREHRLDISSFNLIFGFIIPLDHIEGKILMDVKFESLEWYDVENKCFKRIDNLRLGQWSWSLIYTDGLFSLGS
ncbi:putative F-box protein At1g50870 [Nicotiana tabacum]|uniref:F-box protein At1g50870 n=1 Tax=Nicotiana tabacum TaxID=4097 RepID=A0AC58T4Q1_TOBAC